MRGRGDSSQVIIGSIVILVGVLFLLETTDVINVGNVF